MKTFNNLCATMDYTEYRTFIAYLQGMITALQVGVPPLANECEQRLLACYPEISYPAECALIVLLEQAFTGNFAVANDFDTTDYNDPEDVLAMGQERTFLLLLGNLLTLALTGHINQARMTLYLFNTIEDFADNNANNLRKREIAKILFHSIKDAYKAS